MAFVKHLNILFYLHKIINSRLGQVRSNEITQVGAQNFLIFYVNPQKKNLIQQKYLY